MDAQGFDANCRLRGYERSPGATVRIGLSGRLWSARVEMLPGKDRWQVESGRCKALDNVVS